MSLTAKDAARHLGLSPRKLYELAALTLLARKVDVMVLARISRHSDISLLHRVYYRVTADEIAAKL